jgi:hypothetical protein
MRSGTVRPSPLMTLSMRSRREPQDDQYRRDRRYAHDPLYIIPSSIHHSIEIVVVF